MIGRIALSFLKQKRRNPIHPDAYCDSDDGIKKPQRSGAHKAAASRCQEFVSFSPKILVLACGRVATHTALRFQLREITPKEIGR
jgi:hypothetical protein